MLAIILTAAGAVAASTGLMLWATADVIIGGHNLMYDSGVILMIAGTIVGVLGAFWYRANEAKAAQQIEASAAQRS